jgi:hypothetical protein
MDAFSSGITAVGLCSGVIFKLENLAVERMSLFPALASLRKFLKNCSISATPSMQSLFRVKPVFISTKIASGLGL